MRRAETFEKAIDSVKVAQQCDRIRIKLMQLLEKADTKVAELKYADKQNGLKYEGEDSAECKCGNKIDRLVNTLVYVEGVMTTRAR